MRNTSLYLIYDSIIIDSTVLYLSFRSIKINDETSPNASQQIHLALTPTINFIQTAFSYMKQTRNINVHSTQVKLNSIIRERGSSFALNHLS